MAAADSGETLVSRKKRKRRKTTKRRSRNQQQQPETGALQLQPLTVLPAEPENESAPAPESGFLASVKNLFSGSQSESQPSKSAPESSEQSEKLSATSSPAPSPEVERQLSSVPDVIGDDQDGGELETGEATLGADGISALLEAVAFEEQDVKDTLGELFDWLSETFESEHWKLTDRQLRMLGRPTAQLLNSVWSKLKTRIPDILANWCETTPGASAFLMAFGIVVIPKGLKQWQLSKQRARVALPYSASVSAPVTPKPTAPARPDPTPNAAQYATSGALGIPETRGIVGTP